MSISKRRKKVVEGNPLSPFVVTLCVHVVERAETEIETERGGKMEIDRERETFAMYFKCFTHVWLCTRCFLKGLTLRSAYDSGWKGSFEIERDVAYKRCTKVCYQHKCFFMYIIGIYMLLLCTYWRCRHTRVCVYVCK